jgi:hypothetical protein
MLSWLPRAGFQSNCKCMMVKEAVLRTRARLNVLGHGSRVEYVVFREKLTGRRLADDCLRFQKLGERMVAPFATVA